MVSAPARREALILIDEARQPGARLKTARRVLGIHPRTIQRWGRPWTTIDRRPFTPCPKPANSLTETERQAILAICNQAEHCSLPPSQIVPKLADEQRYLASESSFYRVFAQPDNPPIAVEPSRPVKRGRPKPTKPRHPSKFGAGTLPYLNSTIYGRFFRLYLILDIFSRKIVGWEVHDNESSEHVSLLISKASLAEGVKCDQLILHSDNGSLMKGATMLTTLQGLGNVPSFSRPAVSNDNTYSESLF